MNNIVWNIFQINDTLIHLVSKCAIMARIDLYGEDVL